MDELNLPDAPNMKGDLDTEDKPLATRIARLVSERPYGVLCTQGQSQPYGSLVALAATEDLTSFVFSTPIATRKYRLLSECNQVALVIDNRSGAPAELMRVEAVTATGRAHAVPPGPDFAQWADLLMERHPYLAAFVRAESSALFRVDVDCYFHVCRFQKVQQWVPGRKTQGKGE